jgi:hypothetical protein
VDPGLQGLQGKAERVKPSEISRRLAELHAAKAALRDRHVAVARSIGQYDVNNTYQYVIAREDQHLAWLADAVADSGGALAPVPPADVVAQGKGDDAMRAAAREDADRLAALAAAWRDQAATISNARHRLMVELTIGETLEHARLFRQAAEGRLDVLGRRTGGERLSGSVLPARWVE